MNFVRVAQEAAAAGDAEALAEALRRACVDQPLSAHAFAASAELEVGSFDFPLDSTLMHIACRAGSLEAAQCVHDAFGPMLVNDRNSVGVSPLFYAVESGNASLVAWLLDAAGARTTDLDVHGRSPMHAAATVDIALVLLSRGVHPDAGGPEASTPLCCACSSFGSTELVRVLLENGASVNATTCDGDTPLHSVAEADRERLARLLLAHGADIAVVNRRHATPLHVAARHNSHHVAALLLSQGGSEALLSAEDCTGSTPLHCCARGGSSDVAKLLLAKGVSVGAEGLPRWSTCLHEAAVDRRRAAMLMVLLACGADPGEFDDDEGTPLHVAAHGGNTGAIDLLLRHGADINCADARFRTPLNIAERMGDTRTALMLIARGASWRIFNEHWVVPAALFGVAAKDAASVPL